MAFLPALTRSFPCFTSVSSLSKPPVRFLFEFTCFFATKRRRKWGEYFASSYEVVQSDKCLSEASKEYYIRGVSIGFNSDLSLFHFDFYIVKASLYVFCSN